MGLEELRKSISLEKRAEAQKWMDDIGILDDEIRDERGHIEYYTVVRREWETVKKSKEKLERLLEDKEKLLEKLKDF